jgi:hypothetical protein
MSIELHGLTNKQIAFCDIMWSLQSMESVDSFISTLNKKDRIECRNLIEMIRLTYLDQVNDVDEATQLLNQIASKR